MFTASHCSHHISSCMLCPLVLLSHPMPPLHRPALWCCVPSDTCPPFSCFYLHFVPVPACAHSNTSSISPHVFALFPHMFCAFSSHTYRNFFLAACVLHPSPLRPPYARRFAFPCCGLCLLIGSLLLCSPAPFRPCSSASAPHCSPCHPLLSIALCPCRHRCCAPAPYQLFTTSCVCNLFPTCFALPS